MKEPKALAATVLAFTAVGCGGGGSSGASCPASTITGSVSPGGYYQGPLSISGMNLTLIGIIDDNGNAELSEWGPNGPFAVVSPSSPITVTDGSFTASGTAYVVSGFSLDSGGTSEPVTVSGNIVPGVSICGTSKDEIGAVGTFNVKSQTDYYDIPTTLSAVAATYIFNYSGNGLQNVTINIDSAGNITGNGPSSCSIAGSVTLPNPSFDAYDFTWTSGCLAGPFHGIAMCGPGGSESPAYCQVFGNDGANGFWFYMMAPPTPP